MAETITLKELAVRFRRISDVRRAVQLKSAELAQACVDETQKRMAAGLAPDGSEQPPIKAPRRSKNTGPPLVDYGDLLGSIEAEVEGSTIVITATGPGAQRHQSERPFLGLSEELRETLLEIIAEGIMQSALTQG